MSARAIGCVGLDTHLGVAEDAGERIADLVGEDRHQLGGAQGVVAQAAVIGIPDARMGEVGMAFVVSAPGHAPTAESITAWCRDAMANYKVPRRIEIVPVLPVNAAGKVDKVELRRRAATESA